MVLRRGLPRRGKNDANGDARLASPIRRRQFRRNFRLARPALTFRAPTSRHGSRTFFIAYEMTAASHDFLRVTSFFFLPASMTFVSVTRGRNGERSFSYLINEYVPIGRNATRNSRSRCQGEREGGRGKEANRSFLEFATRVLIVSQFAFRHSTRISASWQSHATCERYEPRLELSRTWREDGRE